MPHGGMWSEGTVSWNDPVEDRGSYRVDSFSVTATTTTTGGLEEEQHTFEADVTSAIIDYSKVNKHVISFRFSTESNERLDFASEGWNGGSAVPELVLVMSSA